MRRGDYALTPTHFGRCDCSKWFSPMTRFTESVLLRGERLIWIPARQPQFWESWLYTEADLLWELGGEKKSPHHDQLRHLRRTFLGTLSDGQPVIGECWTRKPGSCGNRRGIISPTTASNRLVSAIGLTKLYQSKRPPYASPRRGTLTASSNKFHRRQRTWGHWGFTFTYGLRGKPAIRTQTFDFYFHFTAVTANPRELTPRLLMDRPMHP